MKQKNIVKLDKFEQPFEDAIERGAIESVNDPKLKEIIQRAAQESIANREAHGGVRPGAGRRPAGRKQIVLRLIPMAEKKLRDFASRRHVSLSEAAEKLILR